MLDRLLDEAWADRQVRRVLIRHRSRLCLTPRGYRVLCQHGIKLKGEVRMPTPQLFKDDDGAIQEVIESEALSLDDVDSRIAEANDHVAYLQDLRSRFVELESGAAPAAPTPTDPPVPAPTADPSPPAPVGGPGNLEPSAPPANADPGQVPVVPAVDAPNGPTSASNAGQTDPAAATNPTPAAPQIDANGNVVGGPDIVPPVVNA